MWSRSRKWRKHDLRFSCRRRRRWRYHIDGLWGGRNTNGMPGHCGRDNHVPWQDCSYSPAYLNDPATITGQGGTAPGGGAGGQQGCTAGPTTAGAVPGGGGGACLESSGGGSGGYISQTYSAGSLPGTVQITVGAGGVGGRGDYYNSPNYGGGDGAAGEAKISCATPVTPTCTVSFGSNPITQGATTTIQWTSTNADDVYINNIGYVGANGSSTVGPSSTTDYSCTATNAGGGSGSSSATLTVLPASCAPQSCSAVDPTQYIDSCGATNNCPAGDTCSGAGVCSPCSDTSWSCTDSTHRESNCSTIQVYKYALDLTVGLRRGGCPTKLVVRRHAAGSIFSLANGKASRKVCIGVLPKHQRP